MPRGDDRQLESGRHTLATTRTLRPRDRPAVDSAVLCRLAVSEVDRRTGGATGRHSAGAPDRFSVGSETRASIERSRLGLSVPDLFLRSITGGRLELQSGVPGNTDAVPAVRTLRGDGLRDSESAAIDRARRNSVAGAAGFACFSQRRQTFVAQHGSRA